MDRCSVFSCGGESIEGSRGYRVLELLICETHGASV